MKARTKALISNMRPFSVNEFEIKNRIRILARIGYHKGAISFGPQPEALSPHRDNLG